MKVITISYICKENINETTQPAKFTCCILVLQYQETVLVQIRYWFYFIKRWSRNSKQVWINVIQAKQDQNFLLSCIISWACCSLGSFFRGVKLEGNVRKAMLWRKRKKKLKNSQRQVNFFLFLWMIFLRYFSCFSSFSYVFET